MPLKQRKVDLRRDGQMGHCPAGQSMDTVQLSPGDIGLVGLASRLGKKISSVPAT